MKKFLFTIIAIVSFGIVAEAQTNSATIRKTSELSLDNAIEISFNGNGAVLSTEATETYVKSIKARAEKNFNNSDNTNETYFAGTQTTATEVPATRNNTTVKADMSSSICFAFAADSLTESALF